jgi:hypothetical protein
MNENHSFQWKPSKQISIKVSITKHDFRRELAWKILPCQEKSAKRTTLNRTSKDPTNISCRIQALTDLNDDLRNDLLQGWSSLVTEKESVTGFDPHQTQSQYFSTHVQKKVNLYIKNCVCFCLRKLVHQLPRSDDETSIKFVVLH